MKPKELRAFDKAMLRKRAVIENINDQLKNISQIEHSRQPRKPHIDVSVLTGGVPMAFLASNSR
ncbi:hypothetical protein ACH42_15825 [Endozoicomonas sp. (ex Bugula neritina AB1)]|nr:hypothetical protein ACH42_15825 [Endozoicomonas sp. (ex Bugula neritina AB1)]